MRLWKKRAHKLETLRFHSKSQCYVNPWLKVWKGIMGRTGCELCRQGRIQGQSFNSKYIICQSEANLCVVAFVSLVAVPTTLIAVLSFLPHLSVVFLLVLFIFLLLFLIFFFLFLIIVLKWVLFIVLVAGKPNDFWKTQSATGVMCHFIYFPF